MGVTKSWVLEPLVQQLEWEPSIGLALKQYQEPSRPVLW